MKLITDFKDFYDVGRASDFEPTPVFERKQVEEIINTGDKRRWASLGAFAEPRLGNANRVDRVPWHQNFDHNSYSKVTRVWLAFCGHLYFWYKWDGILFSSIAELRTYVRAKPPKHKHDPDYDRVDWRRICLLEIFDEFDGRNPRSPWSSPPPTDKAWEASGLGREPLPAELFRQEGAPYFRWGSDLRDYATSHVPDADGYVLTKNPSLAKLGLTRKWDALETWQQIDQYLGNEMVTQFDPNSARTDELARDYHGFDDKSFKNTAPGARKENRRRNKAEKRGET